MAEPKTVSLNINDLIDGVIDTLQGAKNIVVNVGAGGVDVAQDAVQGANKKFDELIDALQKLKG